MQTQPATIAEVFATWPALLAAESAAQTHDEGQALSVQRHEVERAALSPPAVAARDVWLLVAMTTDRPDAEPSEKL